MNSVVMLTQGIGSWAARPHGCSRSRSSPLRALSSSTSCPRWRSSTTSSTTPSPRSSPSSHQDGAPASEEPPDEGEHTSGSGTSWRSPRRSPSRSILGAPYWYMNAPTPYLYGVSMTIFASPSSDTSISGRGGTSLLPSGGLYKGARRRPHRPAGRPGRAALAFLYLNWNNNYCPVPVRPRRPEADHGHQVVRPAYRTSRRVTSPACPRATPRRC